MLFQLKVYYLETAMEKKKDFIERFSSSITEPAFKDCSFGKDVKAISISIILIKTRPGFEKWDQPRRPRFTELLIGRDGKVLWEKRFEIEIRFDGELFDAFLAADDDEAGKILARESYRALDQLDRLPKRLKDFDKEGFRAAVKDLFERQGLM